MDGPCFSATVIPSDFEVSGATKPRVKLINAVLASFVEQLIHKVQSPTDVWKSIA